MIIEKLNNVFSVMKVMKVPTEILEKEYVFYSKTNDEISIICPDYYKINDAISIEGEYRGFRIKGQLDFSLIGILANVSNLLANKKISLLAVSTFNTDYFFVKDENFNSAINVLCENGFEIE